jgi:hypothetical protein
LSSVIFSQLEDEGYLMDVRRNSAIKQQEIIERFPSVKCLDFDYSNFSAWGFPIIFNSQGQAHSFVTSYNSLSDRNCYPAWRLAPEEPAFYPDVNSDQLKKLLNSGYERYVDLFEDCPSKLQNAFNLRPRVVGLRTNHWSKRSLDIDLYKLTSVLSALYS